MKKKIETPISADVLIHNYGRKPSEETRNKIMDFIKTHKDEKFDALENSEPKASLNLDVPLEGFDDDEGSTGETAKGS